MCPARIPKHLASLPTKQKNAVLASMKVVSESCLFKNNSGNTCGYLLLILKSSAHFFVLHLPLFPTFSNSVALSLNITTSVNLSVKDKNLTQKTLWLKKSDVEGFLGPHNWKPRRQFYLQDWLNSNDVI